MPGRRQDVPSRPPEGVLRRRPAFGPKNIIWAVAHGHDAAISIDRMLPRRGITERPLPEGTLVAEDGHPRMELRQRDRARQALQGAHRDKVIALKDIQAEVELGFDRKLALERGAALPELRRADGVRRASSASNAMPASTSARWTASPSPTNGEEEDLRARLNAPARNPSRTSMSPTASRPAASWSRTRTSACIAGCAPSAARPAPGTCRNILIEMTHAGCNMSVAKPDQQRKRFRRPFRQRQRSGSASANEMFARAILRMGVPVSPRNIFPSNIQGLPTWYEVRVTEAGHLGAPRRRRPDGGDEPADLGQGRRRDRARRLSVLRLDEADADVEIPRRHQRDRRAADRDLPTRLHRSAPAPAVQEHHLCRRAVRRCSTSTPKWSRS